MNDLMPLRIDLVSDVVCPWCVIGYRQFAKAFEHRADRIDLTLQWRAFELNPDMPAGGQDLREHVAEKYGASAEQSASARERLTSLGAELGFHFNYSDSMRMVNTFKAHKLLHWAKAYTLQTALKQALFNAYFTDGRDVGDESTLLAIALSVGLPEAGVSEALASAELDAAVRAEEKRWYQEGIHGVPTFIVNEQYTLQGAQGEAAYGRMLDSLLSRHAA
ncbi:MAG: DsbA family oxidoreductase [Pseudomonadota bacterium]